MAVLEVVEEEGHLKEVVAAEAEVEAEVVVVVVVVMVVVAVFEEVLH